MSDTVITVGDRHIREVHREIQAAAEAGSHIVVKDTRSNTISVWPCRPTRASI